MSNYIALATLNLDNASIVGLDRCVIQIEGSDLVCYNEFEAPFAKFPFDLNSRYRLERGLPTDVGLNEIGLPVPFEVDYDEDYFEEEQDTEILRQYMHVSTMNFTLVIRNEEC
jgi:hypothetical protein